MKKFSKLFKVSALVAICITNVGAYAETAREAAISGGAAGGRWLSGSDGAILSPIILDYVFSGKFKPFAPPNISESKAPSCDTSKKGWNQQGSVYSCNINRPYTKAVPVDGGHLPAGMMKIGTANNQDNGDFVIRKAYVSDVLYYAQSPAIIDADEGLYSGCMVNEATLSKSSAVAINTSSTLTNSTEGKESYGASAKVGTAIGAEISSTTTAEGGVPGVAKVTQAVTGKVSTTVTAEVAGSHERSTSSGLSNSFTDGRIVTNTSILTTKIPGGYLAGSAQYMPYMEIYGLFEMGRVLPVGTSKFLKDTFPDGTKKFRVATSAAGISGAINNELGRTSNFWFGKLTVPTNSLKLPGRTASALMTTSMYLRPFTVSNYVSICKADMGYKKYAPNMKAGLCAAGYKDACK